MVQAVYCPSGVQTSRRFFEDPQLAWARDNEMSLSGKDVVRVFKWIGRGKAPLNDGERVGLPSRLTKWRKRTCVGVAIVSVVSMGSIAASQLAGATSNNPTSPPASVNSQAVPSEVQSAFPAAPAQGSSEISQVQAETVARSVAKTPLTGVASVSAPVAALSTTYGNASNLLGDGTGNLLVQSGTPVWVVTVHAPMSTDGSPSTPPRIEPAYTVILDAVNGQAIDLCIGCATLPLA